MYVVGSWYILKIDSLSIFYTPCSGNTCSDFISHSKLWMPHSVWFHHCLFAQLKNRKLPNTEDGKTSRLISTGSRNKCLRTLRMPKNSQVAYKTLYLEMEPLGLYLAQDIISSHFTASFCLFSLDSRSISYPRKLWKCLKSVANIHLPHCFHISWRFQGLQSIRWQQMVTIQTPSAPAAECVVAQTWFSSWKVKTKCKAEGVPPWQYSPWQNRALEAQVLPTELSNCGVQ